MPALCIALPDLDPDDLALAGGKAVNLGRLLRAGLPVPGGFCVTTDAYRLAADGVPVDDPQAARELLETRPVPTVVAEATVAAYRVLSRDAGVDDVAVAVRSSATAEDLPFASFAGQQDTVLDVAGERDLLAAVRRCWASLWTDRAVAYRAANGIDPGSVRLAVVVQRMVDAAAAGVMFTADPLTGRRGRAVIDAAPGVGDAVVSGAVNPDHFVVATGDGTVRERQVRTGAQASLSDEQLRALADLARQVEALYDGAPQDTEFAADAAGRVWLLQARPITTLYPLPPDAPPPDFNDLRVYFSVNVAQGVLRPFTPMGLQLMRVIAAGVAAAAGAPPSDPLAGPAMLKAAGNRLFFDITALLRSGVGRRLAGFATSHMEARTAAALGAVVADPRLRPLPGLSARGLRRVLIVLWRARVPLRVVHALRDPVAARTAATRRVRRFLDAPLTAGPPSAVARVAAVQRVLAGRVPHIALTVLPLALTGMVAFGLAFRLLGRKVSVDERDAVRRSLPHNPTTQMDLALWALADGVRGDGASVEALATQAPDVLAAAYADGALPPVLQDALTIFLGRFGHRGVAEIDLGLPRWAEAPGQVLSVLAGYLRREDVAGHPTRPDRHFAAGAVRADELVEELAGRRGPLRGALIRLCLRRGRELAGLREVPKEALMALTARVRSELLVPLAVELAAGGRLARPDDLFFLDLREVRDLLAGADFADEIRRRRSVYDAEVRRRRVPRLLLSDGSEPAPPVEPAHTGALRGAPASAGVVTGPARVVPDPVDARLEPGEILVAPSTDPGWTPLFLTAAGLVMEMGGPMSHGAVVAREYGIPAVVGVPDATARIRTGDRITVDGAAGVVVLAGSAGGDVLAGSSGGDVLAGSAGGDAVPVVDPTWQPPVPGSVWVRRQVVEHMPGPLSPLFERLYVDEGLERSTDEILQTLGIDFGNLVPRPFFSTVNGFAYSRGDISMPPRLAAQMLRSLRLAPRYIFRESLRRWRDRDLPRYLEVVARWHAADPEELPDEDLLRGIRELAVADALYWFPVALVVGAAKVSEMVLDLTLRALVPGSTLTTGRFLRGYPSKTLEGDALLEVLADRVRAGEPLRRVVLDTAPARWPEALAGVEGGRALLVALDDWFDGYGHQIYSLDFAEPVPADDRIPTLRSLQARVGREHRDVTALRSALARERDADTERVAGRLDPLRRRIFLGVLRWARRHAPGREESLFYLGAGWPALRRLARELGGRLAAAGVLDAADDVFFLEPEELEAAIGGAPVARLAARARARRALQEQRRLLHPPPAVPPTGGMRFGPFDMSSRETQKRNAPDAAVLNGFAVSPGRVTAPASVVLGPEDFVRMTPGSILVCPTTSPAWTPLFGQARGLVTDIGGVLAHGSIVAREYGIPAVMGTGIGTVRIRHGQTITIDGDRGVVELEP